VAEALRNGAVLLFAYANYANSFVCRQRRLAQQGSSAADREQKKLHPREIYISGGGLEWRP